jgi:hypothetical protein
MRRAAQFHASSLGESLTEVVAAIAAPSPCGTWRTLPSGARADTGEQARRASRKIMTEDELVSLVVDCLHEVSGASRSIIEFSRHFSEYGVDLALEVALFVLLEERLNVDIPNDVVGRLHCVESVVRHLTPLCVSVSDAPPRSPWFEGMKRGS